MQLIARELHGLYNLLRHLTSYHGLGCLLFSYHPMHAGLMRCRFSMLGSIKRLAAMTSNLLLGGNMAMDVMASQV